MFPNFFELVKSGTCLSLPPLNTKQDRLDLFSDMDRGHFKDSFGIKYICSRCSIDLLLIFEKPQKRLVHRVHTNKKRPVINVLIMWEAEAEKRNHKQSREIRNTKFFRHRKKQKRDEPVTNADEIFAKDCHPERAAVMDDEDRSIKETPARVGRPDLKTVKRLDLDKAENAQYESDTSELHRNNAADAPFTDNEPSETLTLFTTPSEGKLNVLNPQNIPQIMRRKLSADQISRLYPLVNEMYKTRIIDDTTGDFLPITGQGQRFTGDQVRTAINDIMLNSPSHRSTDPRKANWLIDYLNKRGVVENTMNRPRKRTSNRRKR